MNTKSAVDEKETPFCADDEAGQAEEDTEGPFIDGSDYTFIIHLTIFNKIGQVS